MHLPQGSFGEVLKRVSGRGGAAVLQLSWALERSLSRQYRGTCSRSLQCHQFEQESQAGNHVVGRSRGERCPESAFLSHGAVALQTCLSFPI